MKLYTKLLGTFLKAGILFGIIVAVFLGMLADWEAGMKYGIFAGCLLWMGVPGILVILSSRRKGSTL